MNTVLLKGTVCAVPSYRTVYSTGAEIATIKLEVNKRFHEGKDMMYDVFNCAAFGERAAFIKSNVKMGDVVKIKGRLEPMPYEAPNGNKRLVANIIIEDIELDRVRNLVAHHSVAN